MKYRKVKTLNSCWKRLIFRGVLLFFIIADDAGIERCINFIHFYFVLHRNCCCIFYFDVESSTFITLNFSTLMLHFQSRCCIFNHDVAFSIMITFSISSYVVVLTVNNFHLFCFTDVIFYPDIIFVPWCRIFYLDVAFSILIDVIFCLHVAFSIMIL